MNEYTMNSSEYELSPPTSVAEWFSQILLPTLLSESEALAESFIYDTVKWPF